MARKVGGRKIDHSINVTKQYKSKDFEITGNKQLYSPQIILLCEDTSSAYYYYKYFIKEHKLNVNLEPKAISKENAKKDYPDGLNEIFRKAALFHRKNDNQVIMIAYDLDEFYRKTNPKTKCKNAYEKFVSENSCHDKYVYLDTFPCFEYWIYLHYSLSDRYFDSFDLLEPALNKLLLIHKFKTLDNTICSKYSKAAKFWVKKINNGEKYLASNFPTDKLVQALSYSRKHRAIIGTNSHSNIWRFFEEFKDIIPDIAIAFKDK